MQLIMLCSYDIYLRGPLNYQSHICMHARLIYNIRVKCKKSWDEPTLFAFLSECRSTCCERFHVQLSRRCCCCVHIFVCFRRLGRLKLITDELQSRFRVKCKKSVTSPLDLLFSRNVDRRVANEFTFNRFVCAAVVYAFCLLPSSGPACAH
jgi:hypothetical protein